MYNLARGTPVSEVSKRIKQNYANYGDLKKSHPFFFQRVNFALHLGKWFVQKHTCQRFCITLKLFIWFQWKFDSIWSNYHNICQWSLVMIHWIKSKLLWFLKRSHFCRETRLFQDKSSFSRLTRNCLLYTSSEPTRPY